MNESIATSSSSENAAANVLGPSDLISLVGEGVVLAGSAGHLVEDLPTLLEDVHEGPRAQIEFVAEQLHCHGAFSW
jgi:hypothetical protein